MFCLNLSLVGVWILAWELFIIFFFSFGGRKDWVKAKATLTVICCFITAHIQITSIQNISSIYYPACYTDTVSEREVMVYSASSQICQVISNSPNGA